MMVDHGLIRAAKIYGNFFGTKPVEALEKRIAGISHFYEDVSQALDHFRLDEYFITQIETATDKKTC